MVESSYLILKIMHLDLVGENSLNTELLTLCGQNGVSLSVFDYSGYFKGAFEPIDKNPSGRVKLEPVLSHALIIKMVRKKMLNDNWFDQKEGVCLLMETGWRNVAEQFSMRLEEQYQEHTFRECIKKR